MNSHSIIAASERYYHKPRNLTPRQKDDSDYPLKLNEQKQTTNQNKTRCGHRE